MRTWSPLLKRLNRSVIALRCIEVDRDDDQPIARIAQLESAAAAVDILDSSFDSIQAVSADRAAAILRRLAHADRVCRIAAVAVLLDARRDVIAALQIGHWVGALAVQHLGVVIVAHHRSAARVGADLDLPAAAIDIDHFADDFIGWLP